MPKIIVFQPSEVEESSNKTDKEIMYEKIMKSSSLQQHHFPSFFEMSEIDEKKLTSNMPSMLLKYILPNCIPILKDTQNFSISIQESRPVMCFKNGLVFIPSNTKFDVVGVVETYFNYVDDSICYDFTNRHPLDLLLTGAYGIQNIIAGQYTQEKYKPYSKPPIQITYFESENDAADKINKILFKVKQIKRSYDRSAKILYNNTIPMLTSPPQKYEHFEPSSGLHKILEKVYGAKLNGDTLQSDYVMKTNNFLNVFDKINILGLSHINSKRLIIDVDDKFRAKKAECVMSKKRVENNLLESKKYAYSLDLFKKPYIELSAKQKVIVQSHMSPQQMSPEEEKLIEEIYTAVRYRGKSLKYLLDDLKSISASQPGDKSVELQMIKNKKQITLICAHVVDQAQQIIKGERDQQIWRYMIDKYSLPNIGHEGHYCKVCGELISEDENDQISVFTKDGSRIEAGERDRLWPIIWKEVIIVITGYVAFKLPINVKKMVTNLAEVLRTEVSIIEMQLSKSKMLTVESTEQLLKIHIAVYAFALVSQMIISNYGDIGYSREPQQNTRGGYDRPSISPFMVGSEKENVSPFISYDNHKRKKGGDRSLSKSVIQNIVNATLFFAKKSQAHRMDSVDGFTIDSIKPIFIKAYKWTQTINVTVETSEDTSLLVNRMNIDPVYAYFETVLSIQKIDSVDKVRILFGQSAGDLQKNEKGYHHLFKSALQILKPAITHHAKTFGGKTAAAKTNITKPVKTAAAKTNITKPVKTAAAKTNITKTNITKPVKTAAANITKIKTATRDDTDICHAQSFMHTAEYVTNKIYGYINIPKSPQIIEFDEKYSHMPQCDIKLKIAQYISRYRPLSGMFQDLAVQYQGDPSPFTLKFKYAKIKGKTLAKGSEKKFNAIDIKKWLKEKNYKKYNDFLQYNHIPYKYKLSKDKFVKKRNSFYEFYEYKCPKLNLHDTNADNVCKKCGLTGDLRGSISYFKKYEKIYDKSLSDQYKKDNSDIRVSPLIVRKKHPAIAWRVNNASILELSKLLKINYNMLFNLGYFEDGNYSSFSNRFDDQLASEKLYSRVEYLKNYHRDIIIFYYTLKNAEKMARLPYEIHKITKDSINALSIFKKLPDLPNVLNTDLNTVVGKNKKDIAELTANYLLNKITKSLLHMYKNFVALRSRDLGLTMLKIIIDLIYKDEYILSSITLKDRKNIKHDEPVEVGDADASGDSTINDDGVIVETEVDIQNSMANEMDIDLDFADLDD
jgi:hypothetical protein